LGGVGVGLLTTLGVGVGFFCPTPTPDVQLDHLLHHIPKFGIPIEMVQFLLKLLLKTEISCFAPGFPLILTAKFHSHHVKESESEMLERSESKILESRSWKFWKGRNWSRTFYHRLHNPGNRSKEVKNNAKGCKNYFTRGRIMLWILLSAH